MVFMLVGASFTVTLQVAVLPLTVFTVITAVPTALAVTLPVLLTVATLLLLVDQVQVLFLAFAGKTVLTRP